LISLAIAAFPFVGKERPVLDRMAEGEVHQGIIAISAALEYGRFRRPV